MVSYKWCFKNRKIRTVPFLFTVNSVPQVLYVLKTNILLVAFSQQYSSNIVNYNSIINKMAFDSILPTTVSAKAQHTSFAFRLFFFNTEAVF